MTPKSFDVLCPSCGTSCTVLENRKKTLCRKCYTSFAVQPHNSVGRNVGDALDSRGDAEVESAEDGSGNSRRNS
jgi:hypothetical protein